MCYNSTSFDWLTPEGGKGVDPKELTWDPPKE